MVLVHVNFVAGAFAFPNTTLIVGIFGLLYLIYYGEHFLSINYNIIVI
uniref:Uncharacterized protein n=1 Tax=viral metagenome TaxID=1070528 RepID=A0A6C0KAL2_9ZZZZ